ncbi:MAG TPA: hypothetical protein DCZ63_14895 [Geobacter sp.]|nr:hypothetical protein [Geobacter sp.]
MNANVSGGNKVVEEEKEVVHIIERMETLVAKSEDLRRRTTDRLSGIIKNIPQCEQGIPPAFSSASAPLFESMASMLNSINYNIEETMSVINRTEV